MADVARLLIVTGILLLVAGIVLAIGARFGMGRLPGDLEVSVGPFRIWAPIATSVVLSLVLTMVLNVVMRR